MLIEALNIPIKIKFKELRKQFNFKKVYESNYEVIFKFSKGYIILYTFGVYTTINITQKEKEAFERRLTKIVPDFNSTDIRDSFKIKIESDSSITVKHNQCILPEFKLEYLRILSLVLAESVAIESFESNTSDILVESLKYSRELKNKGRYPSNHKKLLQFIGFATTTRQEILSNLYIADAPDETWNDVVLEKFYMKLKDMFDIEQRFRSLNLSLTSIQESIEIMTDILNTKKAHRMELWIIALITFEILLSLWDRFKIHF